MASLSSVLSTLSPLHLVAILVALGATFSNAVSNLSVRVGTSRGQAKDAVFVVMCINLLILIPLVGIYYYPNYGITRLSLISFTAAGVLGTLLGRVFQYTSIDRIGASRTVPVIASNGIIASILGVVVLGESVTAVHSLGILLVVVGVAAISWETTQENPDDLPRRELLLGLLLPFVAALAFGIEPIFASFGFQQGTPAPVGLAIKTVTATTGFVGYLRWQDSLPSREVLESGNTRWFILAGITNTGFLLGYYVALELAPVSVVIPIIVSQTLFIVVLSAVFMPQRLERITWKLATAAMVVVVGVLIITVFG